MRLGLTTTTILTAFSSEVVIHARRQHPVGQGGFHSGEIIAPRDASLIVSTQRGPRVIAANAFRYVYDCGSRQGARCRELAKLYATSSHSRTLDLLFLSHFDDDHVNGVPDLLHAYSGVKVDTIIMPWVDDVERLIAFARAYSQRRSVSDFFEGLVIDLQGTLSSFNPGRILFIRRRPPDLEGEPVDIGPSGEGPEGSFRYKISTDSAGGGRAPPRGSRGRFGSTEVITLFDDAVIDVDIRTTTFSWLFKPYVRPADPERVEDFQRQAETLLGWHWGTFRSRIADRTTRENLVRNEVQAKALAKAYRTAFSNRNLTSLCLYSGPSASGPSRGHLMVKLGHTECGRTEKIGWLGTADALLREPRDTLAFVTHYQAQQFSVATLALPHHGALPNYSPLLVSTFSPVTCVASAKPPKNWRHPHPDVIADVEAQGAKGVCVSDAEISVFDEVYIIVHSR